MSTVIQVENLSKTYRLGSIGGGSLRADVSRWLAKLRGRPDPNLKIGQEHHARLEGQEFRALRDVSFNVKQGEILGIIGRNGAGKSTLLKILSRVTAPSSGLVKVRGRIASLLEVGTGFHPELTGRENIFLNGAILGMTKAEIKRKFDEIVDFSGVEQFLDTPVKRYSSGMYVRLAFAVAAHLEPEVLIVDEVLAVGDGEFQKKCMGKMKHVSKSGRTILFVSHSMPAIRQLCTRAILLVGGQVQTSGDPVKVAENYLASSHTDLVKRKTNGLLQPHIVDMFLRGQSGLPAVNIRAGEKASLLIQIETKGNTHLIFGMTIFNSDDIGIFSTITSDTQEFIPETAKLMSIEIPTGSLNAGKYRVEGALCEDGAAVDNNECYLQFEIHRGGAFELNQGNAKGLLRLPGTWSFNDANEHKT